MGQTSLQRVRIPDQATRLAVRVNNQLQARTPGQPGQARDDLSGGIKCVARYYAAMVEQDTSTPQLELGPPVLVSRAPLGLTGWGPWQFPALHRTPDGRLQLGYHVSEDAATAYGTEPGMAVSDDEGVTWSEVSSSELAESWISGTIPLSNGDLLRQIVRRSCPVDAIKDRLPTPIEEWTGGYGERVTIYLDEAMPADLAGWRFSRLPKGGANWIEETAKVNIPGTLRNVNGGVLVFPWLHRIALAPDESLWGIGHSRRQVDRKLQPQLVVLFVRSTDHGHTWDLLSEIDYQPHKKADEHWAEREGFTEPNIAFLPDGSIFCLIRTTDGHGVAPLYSARSTDNGHTWSKPVLFDDLGVWPALLTLKSGVTIASYGRPGLYVRATGDPDGRLWSPRMTVVPPGEVQEDTCSYSDLVSVSDRSALIAYSDFHFPDEQGRPRKSILVRRIDVL